MCVCVCVCVCVCCESFVIDSLFSLCHALFVLCLFSLFSKESYCKKKGAEGGCTHRQEGKQCGCWMGSVMRGVNSGTVMHRQSS